MPPLAQHWTRRVIKVKCVRCNSTPHLQHSRVYTLTRNMILVMTAFTSLFFVQLYRSNLLLHIVHLEAPATPNTLAEVVQAVEEGIYATES